MQKQIKTGFIGFGLIGGSIARALKKHSSQYEILVYQNQMYPDESLQTALIDLVADEITADINAFSVCDIIFLCTPILSNIAYLKDLKDIVKNDCIITDVGSVKENIHVAAEELDLSENFIGGHPMAGSERTGYENSSALLLENAYYILTPAKETKTEYINTMLQVVKDIKALPMLLDYKEHDKITAAISHVPHIIAAELVNLVRTSDDKDEKMRALLAGGFKDITRIASSSPIMWQNICLTNKDSILNLLDEYKYRLSQISNAIKNSDEAYLHELFEQAAIYRSSIPNEGKGLMNKSYELYLDVEDKPGSIAAIASLLAYNDISIKNIGITHNREYQQGALCIEFYDEKALDSSYEILSRNQFTLYIRK